MCVCGRHVQSAHWARVYLLILLVVNLRPIIRSPEIGSAGMNQGSSAVQNFLVV